MTNFEVESDPRTEYAHQWRDARFSELMQMHFDKIDVEYTGFSDNYLNMKESQIRSLAKMYTDNYIDTLPESVKDIPDQLNLFEG